MSKQTEEAEMLEISGEANQTQVIRSSPRERKLTEKGQALHEQAAKKNEKAFNKAYELWRKSAKDIRTQSPVARMRSLNYTKSILSLNTR